MPPLEGVTAGDAAGAAASSVREVRARRVRGRSARALSSSITSFARAAVTGFASRSRSSADIPSNSATSSASLSKRRRAAAAASLAARSASSFARAAFSAPSRVDNTVATAISRVLTLSASTARTRRRSSAALTGGAAALLTCSPVPFVVDARRAHRKHRSADISNVRFCWVPAGVEMLPPAGPPRRGCLLPEPFVAQSTHGCDGPYSLVCKRWNLIEDIPQYQDASPEHSNRSGCPTDRFHPNRLAFRRRWSVRVRGRLGPTT